MIENESATYRLYGVHSMKVYAVYSIPKSPEYRLEKLFKTKELAKQYIKHQKDVCIEGMFETREDYERYAAENKLEKRFLNLKSNLPVFDIQLEDIEE